MFALWSSPNHIPLKSRGPIKKRATQDPSTLGNIAALNPIHMEAHILPRSNFKTNTTIGNTLPSVSAEDSWA